MIRKIGPVNYLTGVCFLWGVVMVRSFTRNMLEKGDGVLTDSCIRVAMWWLRQSLVSDGWDSDHHWRIGSWLLSCISLFNRNVVYAI